MIYDEDDLIPISSLQHYVFCPRQFALIHIEQMWQENVLTAEGRVLHEKAHSEEDEWRNNHGVIRSLRLRSLEYGLVGQADIVELSPLSEAEGGTKIPNRSGAWRVLPIEYKRGSVKLDKSDEVQLCAQTLCLEEMLKINICDAAFFYATNRRRHIIKIDKVLRQYTVKIISEVRQLMVRGETPKGEFCKKCYNCSLIELCGIKFIDSLSEKKLSSYINGLSDPD